MSKLSLRRLSKPSGFDQRIRRELASTPLAVGSEPRSLAAARSRAERLKVSLDDMLLEDRERLRASTYPGSECFEPYEVEEYAVGALSPERARHIETCYGCRVLLGGVAPSDGQVAAFLDEVRETEPDQVVLPFRARGFWFDLIAASAAAVVVGGIGYFGLQFFGPVAGDPSIRSAVLSQVTGLVRPIPVISLWVVSLVALTRLLSRYGREVLKTSGGALTAGVVLGLIAIFIGWKNVGDSTDSMRAVLRLQQVQLTEALAGSLGPDALNSSGSGLDAKKLHIDPSSLVRVAAWQPEPGRLLFQSSVEGLPGTMVADMQPNGGQMYWNFANRKEPLDQILYGTVESSGTGQFVLVGPDQRKYVIKTAVGYAVGRGSKVMVLVDPADQKAVSVHALISKHSTED